jgi:hypothetical protein
MNHKVLFFSLFLILVLFHGGLALNYPARNWLQLNESERVCFLCGYVMGVDTGKDVAFDYDGKMYENLFNPNFQYRKRIMDKTSELYKNKKNLYINWQSMILLSYLSMEGEPEDVIKWKLDFARATIGAVLEKKFSRQGDNWLAISESDRMVFLDGLIEGIQIGMSLKKQNDTILLPHLENLFKSSYKAVEIANYVSDILKDPFFHDFDIRFIFPLAYLKFAQEDKAKIDSYIRSVLKK